MTERGKKKTTPGEVRKEASDTLKLGRPKMHLEG